MNHGIRSQSLFHPPLPGWKADAYGKTQNGIYTKIFLRYARKFWDNADYILFADPDRRGYFAVWQDMESHGKFFLNGTNILMVTVVQADSRRVETQSKKETVDEVQKVLKQMYGESIPDPLDVFIPVWSTDPAFYGCWSNVAVGTSKEDFQLMQQPIGGLFFAGEATDYDYNGFVAGGYHSGKREAHKVLQALTEMQLVIQEERPSYHTDHTLSFPASVGVSQLFAWLGSFLTLGSVGCLVIPYRRSAHDPHTAPFLSDDRLAQ